MRECFTRVAAGESTEAIAADMQRRGVKRARSTEWQRERVYAMVTQPAYRGEWTADRKHRVVIQVPRIVDDALWYQVEDMMLAAKRRGLRRTRTVYMLEEVARCECGAPILIHSTASGAGAARYYYCKRRRRRAYGETCGIRPWRVERAEARVWAAVLKFLARPDLPGRVAAFLAASAGPDERSWAKDLVDYEARLARLQRTEATLLERFRRDLVSQESLDRELERMSAERRLLVRQVETARRQVEGAHQTRGAAASALGVVEQLREGLATADALTRRELVRALVPGRLDHHVVLGEDEIEVQILLAQLTPAIGLAEDPGCRKPRQAKLTFKVAA